MGAGKGTRADDDDELEVHEVHSVVCWRGAAGERPELQVQWVGCQPSQNTWEPAANVLAFAPYAIRCYMEGNDDSDDADTAAAEVHGHGTNANASEDARGAGAAGAGADVDAGAGAGATSSCSPGDTRSLVRSSTSVKEDAATGSGNDSGSGRGRGATRGIASIVGCRQRPGIRPELCVLWQGSKEAAWERAAALLAGANEAIQEYLSGRSHGAAMFVD